MPKCSTWDTLTDSDWSGCYQKRKGFMKKKTDELDELRPEYDFSKMAGGVRGKYVERYRAGTNLVLLEPDIAEAFPTTASVNEALRSLLMKGLSSAPAIVNEKQPNKSV